MTNNPPEDEAEKAAREYVKSEWYESWPNTQGFSYDEICESEVEAHLAGQAVGEKRGFQMALDKVKVELRKVSQIGAYEIDGANKIGGVITVYKMWEVIDNLKATHGKEKG